MEMDARQYAAAFVIFRLRSLLCPILWLQRFLSLCFASYLTTPLAPHLELNTAVNFSTTATWPATRGKVP
jgi:K+-transporting ATPase A subunit